MAIENMLLDEKGNIPVWGHATKEGRPYYTFKLTDEDSFVLFPNTSTNPKAPKFTLKVASKREEGG